MLPLSTTAIIARNIPPAPAPPMLAKPENAISPLSEACLLICDELRIDGLEKQDQSGNTGNDTALSSALFLSSG